MEVVAHLNFGPLLIGVLLSAFLFGVVSLQAYLFYCRTPLSGRIYIHLPIALIWVLNAAHLCLLSHAEYFYLVTNFLNPSAGDSEVWSLSLNLAISSLITFIVQCFFVGQIWSYNVRNALLLGAIFILMVVRLGVGIGATVISFDVAKFGHSHRQNVWLTICFATMLPADVWVTASMLYVLYTKRGLELRYYSYRHKVFLYIMTTGAVPCIISVVAFLCFFLQNNGLAFLAVHLILGELYTITLFSILHTCAVLSPPSGRQGGVRQTITDESITTTYSKSMMRNELDTHVTATESTFSGQKQGLHVEMDNLPSLDYRGKRERQVFTPIHEIPMTSGGNDVKGNETPRNSHRASLVSPRNSESHPARPWSLNSVATDSTAMSRITGPSIAWESRSSRSFERIGHDVGNVEWDSSDLQWEPRLS